MRLLMREMLATCHQCKQPLVVIDNRRLPDLFALANFKAGQE